LDLVAGDQVPEHAQGIGCLGPCRFVAGTRVCIVVGEAHAVDQREDQFGVDSPGGRPQLPLVGAATAVFGEQGVEAGEEFGGGSVESGQALRESVESGVEGGGQLGRVGDQAAEVPHGEVGRDRRHATEAAGDS